MRISDKTTVNVLGMTWKEKCQSHQNQDKESADYGKPKLIEWAVFTCLALKVAGKKSHPSKKHVTHKIPDKQNANRRKPKPKSKYWKCLQKEIESLLLTPRKWWVTVLTKC